METLEEMKTLCSRLEKAKIFFNDPQVDDEDKDKQKENLFKICDRIDEIIKLSTGEVRKKYIDMLLYVIS